MKNQWMLGLLLLVLSSNLLGCSKNQQNLNNHEKTTKTSQEKLAAVVANPFNFSVMQFNVWQEGTQVSGGFQGIINEIAYYAPDFVTLSEVRNYYSTYFFERAIQALAAKGKTYYGVYSYDRLVLSKHPIIEFSVDGEISGANKIVARIAGRELAIYSAHLDYTHYAVYLPRGYDAITWKKLSAPVTDLNKIMEVDAGSNRVKEINAFLKSAKQDIEKGRIVVLGGDFNEASHLDWTEATKNLFDHNGVVAPWRASTTLYKNGFIDSYRKKYPDEVKYPGMTWPAAGGESWAPDADERDRIDFIYYYNNGQIDVADTKLIGPLQIIVRNKPVADNSQDPISKPQGVWPSDHRALLSVFSVK